ncbi:MAG: glycosyltransferase [Phycisphaeraceae bacterium]|nr:MAG: glycosyltransferase [Phycisphaeraceae bacterium]
MSMIEVKPAGRGEGEGGGRGAGGVGGGVGLSVVIPMYREAGRIGATLADAAGWLAGWGEVSELILVDDGSPDGTAGAVEPWVREGARGNLSRVVLLRHGVNRGKGAAVRTGLSAARGSWCLMMDADNSARVREVERLWAGRVGAVMVCGSRNAAGSRVVTRWTRRAMGRCFHAALRVMGMAMLRDTQCGFKLYRGDLARGVSGLGREDRFAFDLEHVLIARRWWRALGGEGEGVREVGIEWAHAEGGTVRPVRDGVSMLWRAGVIRWRGVPGLEGAVRRGVEVEAKPAGAAVAR